MKYKILAIIVFIFFIGAGCKTETWQGFYYPNGCLDCEEDWIKSPIFSTLEECRDWADAEKIESQNPNDDYECGKNCKSDGYLNICKETLK